MLLHWANMKSKKKKKVFEKDIILFICYSAFSFHCGLLFLLLPDALKLNDAPNCDWLRFLCFPLDVLSNFVLPFSAEQVMPLALLCTESKVTWKHLWSYFASAWFFLSLSKHLYNLVMAALSPKQNTFKVNFQCIAISYLCIWQCSSKRSNSHCRAETLLALCCGEKDICSKDRTGWSFLWM